MQRAERKLVVYGKGLEVKGLFQESGEKDLLVDDLDPHLGQPALLRLVFRTGNDEQIFFGLPGHRFKPGTTGAFNHV